MAKDALSRLIFMPGHCGSSPEWYQIWIDGEPGPTGCKAFEDIAVRSDRAKQAHVTMKENEYNDPRQLKLF